MNRLRCCGSGRASIPLPLAWSGSTNESVTVLWEMSNMIRDQFLSLLAQGKTHLEAYREFDEGAIRAAVRAELNGNEIVRKPLCLERPVEEYEFTTRDGKPALFELTARAHTMERDERDIETEAYALWMAGWTSHPVRLGSQVMSWYWRRPPRRPGKLGRLYLSTTQAFNAMMKDKK